MALSQTTLLVVEDEALILYDLAMSLRDIGYTVIEASNADSAISILEQNSEIACLITDIDMPGSIDGLALAHAVFERWPPCRLIIISGGQKLSRDQLPTGARFLSKPTELGRVNAALNDLGIAA